MTDSISTALALRERLEDAGVITDTGLRLDHRPLTYDEAEALARMFGRVHRSLAWNIGDLIIYSERAFGELWPQIAEATRLSPQTAQNYASLCRKFPHDRRRPALNPSVHEAVRSLEPAEQDRWLDEAEAEGLSREDVRARVRAARNGTEHEHRWVCADCGEAR